MVAEERATIVRGNETMIPPRSALAQPRQETAGVSPPGEERCREREPREKSGGGRAGKKGTTGQPRRNRLGSEDGEGRIGRQGRVGKVTVRQSGCGAGIRGSVIIYLGGQVPGGL